MWRCCYSLGVLLYTLSSAKIVGFEDNKRPVDKLLANTLRRYKWRKKSGAEIWQRLQEPTPDPYLKKQKASSRVMLFFTPLLALGLS